MFLSGVLVTVDLMDEAPPDTLYPSRWAGGLQTSLRNPNPKAFAHDQYAAVYLPPLR